MNSIGLITQKNIDGKKFLDDYIKSMEKVVAEQKCKQLLYMNEELEEPDYFDYYRSVKFCRAWEVLLSMDDYAARNLLLLFNACGNNCKNTLDVLAGFNVSYGTATIRVMLTKARKAFKKLYKEKYGDN